MTMDLIGNDVKNHPFPKEGRWIEIRYRPGVWAKVDPIYDEKGEGLKLSDIKSFAFPGGRYFFLCWNFWLSHGYVGWKPISPYSDKKFYWQKLYDVQQLMKGYVQFFQRSSRGGWGRLKEKP